MTTFTILPAGGPADLDGAPSGRLAPWLPAVGVLLAGPVAGALLAIQAAGASAPRQLLAAVVALAVVAVLTGGLHLDGLADTADGLGSRRPAEAALEIMRRSDIGPMGVAALVFTVLIQAGSLAAIRPGWRGAAALAIALITARTGVLLATGAPAARPGGFGALVAGSASTGARWAAAGTLLIVVAAAAAAAAGPILAVRAAGAVLAGLAAAWLIRWVAARKLGGMTGDVFGAQIELGTATVLLVLALHG
ncbi:MAG: adenosylcobinamide-GDP ribazoletransferase [Streptosporangiaceae bacterium]